MLRIPVNIPSSSSRDQLITQKKIGQGKFAVYHAKLDRHRSNFALKVFPKDESSIAHYQKELVIAKLNHPNIIRYSPIICRKPGFSFILTEYAPYGNFFDLLRQNVLDDVIVRTYFHQLVEGLEYIQSKGYAHLDLKLENMMVGDSFALKIIDFDQAQKTSDRRITSGGTEGYRAPEVIDGSCRNLEAADIYSLGVILYALKSREYPFVEETNGNVTKLVCYDVFHKENMKFWRAKAGNMGDLSFFSEDFKMLINNLLVQDPNKRYKIKEIKASRWYNGPILDDLILRDTMTKMISSKKC